MSKKIRPRLREARNTRIVLDGPIMKIRLKLEALMLYRKSVENGYEGSLSDWINFWILDTFKETKQ